MEISPVCYPVEYLLHKHGSCENWELNFGSIQSVDINEFGLEVEFEAHIDDARDTPRFIDGLAVLELQDRDGRIICESLLEFEGEFETGTLCFHENR